MEINDVEKKWIDNFKNSDVVKNDTFDIETASEIFENFTDYYDNIWNYDIETCINKTTNSLKRVGIEISKKAILNYISSNSIDNSKEILRNTIMKKTFWLLKSLSKNRYININDPFEDNNGDVFLLLQVATTTSTKDNKTKDDAKTTNMELPDFYNKYVELPKGYPNDRFIDELFNNTNSKLIGFEPNEEEFNKLEKNNPRKTFYDYAIGDGSEKYLNICKGVGMSSFLEPDMDYLNNFYWFDENSKIVKKKK